MYFASICAPRKITTQSDGCRDPSLIQARGKENRNQHEECLPLSLITTFGGFGQPTSLSQMFFALLFGQGRPPATPLSLLQLVWPGATWLALSSERKSRVSDCGSEGYVFKTCWARESSFPPAFASVEGRGQRKAEWASSDWR